ncbi:DUF3488 and transglutaminase-like domain-containing protein, partial [Umezawaea sp. NPDC059074]|uniref:DUF3488 and transglutaminase-like domain-containing protein n=1 Tax=Umezawaea sp. NPDC059074 TaxID=3346716 RepID=UPI0036B4C274
ALAPSLAVVLLSQAFQASGGPAAVLWAFGYALVAVLVVGAAELGSAKGFRLRLVAPVLAIALGVAAVFLAIPAPGGSFSLKDGRTPVTAPAVVANPLDEIGARLTQPDTVVFRVRTDAAVDRWTVALFDRFDGVNWSTGGEYRTLGSALAPDPTVTAATVAGSATITMVAPTGPWLPTAGRTRSVTGADVVVDPTTGTLLATSSGADTYGLTWAAVPDGDRSTWTLGGGSATAALPDAPAAVADLAKIALNGAAPSFSAAVALEKWFHDNYKLANAENTPTGRAYPQLLHFLGTTKRGTTEQFAAAYVVLARASGIPARLAVGYRQPEAVDAAGEHVVHNADVVAWPEVPVAGRGWIALDPSGAVAKTGLGDQTQVAPPQPAPSTPPAPKPSVAVGDPIPGPPPVPDPPAAAGSWWPLWLAAVLLVGGIAAVPVAKIVRRRARRGRPPIAAVVGASLEARDLLRDHGVVVRRGMTVRDLAQQAVPVLGDRLDADLHVLRGCVDLALWSGDPVSRDTADRAWSAVDGARKRVATRPRSRRIRAAFTLRGLLSPRR